MAATQELIWESQHSFFFDTRSKVTPKSLSANLLGLDGMLKLSAEVLGTMLGSKILAVEVVMTGIELNSYRDNFLYRVIFGQGDEAEKNLDALRKKLHLENVTPGKLIGFAAAGVIGYGIWQHVMPDAPTQEAAINIHIENSFNSLGSEVGLPKEEVMALVDSVLHAKREEVKKNVMQLVRPDGQDAKGSIAIDDKPNLTIPAEAIAEIPSIYKKEAPREELKKFKEKDIALRALDLDRPDTGWWAVVPDISDKRLPVSLGEGLDPSKIPVGKYQVADFSVVYKRNKKGESKPKRIILERIRRK